MQTEAIDRDEWERLDKGLPPLPKKKIVLPKLKEPEVENQIRFKDVSLDKFIKLISSKRRSISNPDGIKFIGMDVVIEIKGKRGPGRPGKDEEEPKPEIMSGWMIEGDWLELFRHIRDKIDLNKISW